MKEAPLAWGNLNLKIVRTCTTSITTITDTYTTNSLNVLSYLVYVVLSNVSHGPMPLSTGSKIHLRNIFCGLVKDSLKNVDSSSSSLVTLRCFVTSDDTHSHLAYMGSYRPNTYRRDVKYSQISNKFASTSTSLHEQKNIVLLPRTLEAFQ